MPNVSTRSSLASVNSSAAFNLETYLQNIMNDKKFEPLDVPRSQREIPEPCSPKLFSFDVWVQIKKPRVLCKYFRPCAIVCVLSRWFRYIEFGTVFPWYLESEFFETDCGGALYKHKYFQNASSRNSSTILTTIFIYCRYKSVVPNV
jgi:hypothetical protein